MPSPNIQQGTLNRVKASVTFPSNSSLNVSASFLGREMVRIAFDGEITQFIPTATGVVQSPEPYQLVTVTINMNRAQGLAQLYEQAFAASSNLGTCVVRPDSTALNPYTIQNCAVANVEPLTLNGENVAYNVTVRGYRLINSNLWD